MSAASSGSARSSAPASPSGSSSAGPTTGTRSPSSARSHRACSSRSTIAQAGHASPARKASSRSVSAGFAGTTTRPARNAPTWAASEMTDELVDQSTRSPGTSPAPHSRPATRRVAPSNSSALHHRGEQPGSQKSGAVGSDAHRCDQATGSVPDSSTAPTPVALAPGRWSVHGLNGGPSRRRRCAAGGSSRSVHRTGRSVEITGRSAGVTGRPSTGPPDGDTRGWQHGVAVRATREGGLR